jgi:hypothetical protein
LVHELAASMAAADAEDKFKNDIRSSLGSTPAAPVGCAVVRLSLRRGSMRKSPDSETVRTKQKGLEDDSPSPRIRQRTSYGSV